MGSDALIKLKGSVSPSGGASGEIIISKDTPGVIASIFYKWKTRKLTHERIIKHIFDKTEANEPLDDEDIEFLNSTLGEAEAKWIHKKAIAARAATLFEGRREPLALPPKAQMPPAEQHHTQSTAEDWISKFWDDAGLVSDKVLAEVYARILAQEAASPGTCSMRTLRALRYMDSQTANDFAKLTTVTMEHGWVLGDSRRLKKYGIEYSLLLALDEAGLININTALSILSNDTPRYLVHGSRVLRIEPGKSGIQWSLYPLTTAGMELARVAEVEINNPDYILDVGRFIIMENLGRTVNVFWADAGNEIGNFEKESTKLLWNKLEPSKEDMLLLKNRIG